MRFLVLDYETRSEADLKVVGAYEYARHPTTEILCVSWRYGTRAELRKAKTKSWSPAFSREAPQELLRLLREKRNVAHNALFEQLITKFVLPKYIKNLFMRELIRMLIPADWICTAALAAALALPRKLEGATAALKLVHQKDMEGHRLMMKMSKPRKPTKNNPAKWHCKKKDLLRLIQYCEHDVAAEVELFLGLPPLNEIERAVWELDQRTNLRGFAVDRPLVEKIIGHVEVEKKTLDRELFRITGGRVESSDKVKALSEFVRSCGVELPNLQKETVEDTLALGDLDPIAKRALEIRAAASKTSTAKYYAMEARSRTDGRVRDLLMYHGASTGRWTGTGVQIQNFPRGTLSNSELAVDMIHQSDLEVIRLLYGDPLECFSSVLRSAITATPGYEIFCGDYAGIEVRKLFWMAGHEEGLRAYREGRDIYREMAQVVFGVRRLSDVTKEQREIGKRIILGCGFGMGAPKFLETCLKFRVNIDLALAKKSVAAYREVHSPVPKMWYAIEDAATSAAMEPGKVFATRKTRWWMEDNFLWCGLPSGRPLAYYGARTKMEPTPWKEMKPKLYHWGVHPKTKKWVFDGTYGGRLVENCVQASARDVMAQASLRLDKADYPLLFSVHDELANEKKKGRGDLAEYTALMSEVPAWAKGLPIKVETWSGARYRK